MPRASSMLEIQPIGQQVLVQILPSDALSAHLIVIQSDNLTQKATVLAVGQGVSDLTVGDTVLCRPLTGITVGDHMLLPQSGILAIL